MLGEIVMGITLTINAFNNNGDIPSKFTCDGSDISPEMSWTNIPFNAKSLVLIVDDPDAPDPDNPKMTWIHWVLYNIPAVEGNLKEGISAIDLPRGTLQGLNDWGKTGYGGPCPPIGTHRYFHKLYALDVVLSNLNRPTKADLLKAMSGHVIDSIEVVGLYKKQR